MSLFIMKDRNMIEKSIGVTQEVKARLLCQPFCDVQAIFDMNQHKCITTLYLVLYRALDTFHNAPSHHALNHVIPNPV